ncbi:transcriptional regulator [Nocardiopsis sp. HNM0947]|uniref:Transcriptional regulator n=1 Tax=Nocardiopsis coralli TaxID=2772213 RepID=A0ABR9P8G1_9ACTN|nr:transcriptional regulator [Nocardiopsis coralli]MBE3000131.1 transcriptional regulator [Nocardiopsis coralli]
MKGQLDPVIHPTHRLRICAMLAAGTTVETAVLKEELGLSPSALSKQITALVDAGYVTQNRFSADSRRAWLALTRKGQKAYRAHVQALREIVADPGD